MYAGVSECLQMSKTVCTCKTQYAHASNHKKVSEILCVSENIYVSETICVYISVQISQPVQKGVECSVGLNFDYNAGDCREIEEYDFWKSVTVTEKRTEGWQLQGRQAKSLGCHLPDAYDIRIQVLEDKICL